MVLQDHRGQTMGSHLKFAFLGRILKTVTNNDLISPAEVFSYNLLILNIFIFLVSNIMAFKVIHKTQNRVYTVIY
jgi:hypothetical protein